MIINLKFHRKKRKIKVKKLSEFEKISGLMFKSRRNENILFDFQKDVKISIHSFFVFFPFLAVWLDDKNKVLEVNKVEPFTIAVLPKKPFRKLIEIPFNKENKKIIRFFDDKETFK